ncbi:plasmalemma vesicle associated protein a [Colossoma macropomum]|uniref:plasmalemma vesicle associated protein a n=1 Tax=Colossoma macropomum TaxID=42526 RepID=UPI001864A8A7|nr:plasmalemma vesicle associated protein a [Colossoma macropomum]
MYNSGYSKAKMGLAAKNLHRSKERSCGYYMRIILFFSSLIQSLIIVSLVLFLIYGEPQQTVEEKRIQELEQSYSKLSLENVALRAKEKNLTQQLNITLHAKKLSEKDVTNLRRLANISATAITNLQRRISQNELEKRTAAISPRLPCALPGNDKYLEHRLRQAEELQRLLRANFTEQMYITKHELENAQKDRIRYQLEGIELRRDKGSLEERITMYEKKCKEDFVHSLEGIPNVTKEFLKRVDELFSKHISFQLSCDKQSIQLENIRANCSSLSTEVENKLQAYLDKVGSQVTVTIGANAKCMTENKRLKEDATWCMQNRTGIMEENRRVLKQTQQNYDKEVERLLLDITKLKGQNKLLDNQMSVKEIEIKMLSDKVKDLNTSLTNCGKFPGGASSSFSTLFAQNRYGGSSPGSNVMGSFSSTFGTGLGSSTGYGATTYAKPPVGSGGLPGTGLATGQGMQRPDTTGSNPAGTFPFGAGKMSSEVSIVQHLRELQQYTTG